MGALDTPSVVADEVVVAELVEVRREGESQIGETVHETRDGWRSSGARLEVTGATVEQ